MAPSAIAGSRRGGARRGGLWTIAGRSSWPAGPARLARLPPRDAAGRHRGDDPRRRSRRSAAGRAGATSPAGSARSRSASRSSAIVAWIVALVAAWLGARIRRGDDRRPGVGRARRASSSGWCSSGRATCGSGRCLVVAPRSCSFGWPVAWLGFGLAWTLVGVLLLAARAGPDELPSARLRRPLGRASAARRSAAEAGLGHRRRVEQLVEAGPGRSRAPSPARGSCGPS